MLALERALALPAEHGLLAFTGPPTSGKTEALVRRFAALVAADPALARRRDRHRRARRRRARAGRAHDATRRASRCAARRSMRSRSSCCARTRSRPASRSTSKLIDPLDAEEIFERAAAPLFSAEWSDWLGADVDPEIAGLRTPARFAAAALRLIRKLRDSGIDVDAFLAVAHARRDDVLREPAEPRRRPRCCRRPKTSTARRSPSTRRSSTASANASSIWPRSSRGCTARTSTSSCGAAASPPATRSPRRRDCSKTIRRSRARCGGGCASRSSTTRTTSPPRRCASCARCSATRSTASPSPGDPDAATQTFAGARPERILGRAVTTVPLAPRTLHPQIARGDARA